jgi:hypothetical protein
MSRIASLLVGGFVALGLVGCDVDLEDRDPDVIDTEPGNVIIEDDKEPGIDIEVDDEPDNVRPGIDVDVDTNRPAPGVDAEIDLNPRGTAGEGTTPLTDPEER